MLKFTDYLNEFCNKYGYIGKMDFDNKTKEYNIIISKGDDNAGIFLSKEELKACSNKQLEDLLDMLHIGFKAKFNK
ncbi:MAG: hypothetical protein WCD89_19485 [Anaerocolumna sp.]